MSTHYKGNPLVKTKLILKKNINNRLSLLPDEIYKLIINFASDYISEIPRWNKDLGRWRKHCNIKCCKCNRKNVALAHFGNGCNSWGHQSCESQICDNTLICFSCVH